jgi:hypothetical protein
MRPKRAWKRTLILLLSVLIVAACSDTLETVKVNELGWQIEALGLPVAELFAIHAVGNLRMPTYNDCTNEEGNARSPHECSLSMVFLASPDYGSNDNSYSEHVQTILGAVFGARNMINRNGAYGNRLRPFSFYATEYRYDETTPIAGECNPGLPVEWAPAQSNGRDVNVPAWDCNLALSTAAVEVDIGLVIHKTDLPDRNRYNLFSSEYNSYAAIMHELSHATFAMSDEAPSALQGGAFFPEKYPNIFRMRDQRAQCELVCQQYQSSCVDIPKVDREGAIIPASQSGFLHCSTAADDDIRNLMYFYPQPTPGDNQEWADRFDYRYLGVRSFFE